jgi:plasmid maintenance system antidote protein VapI
MTYLGFWFYFVSDFFYFYFMKKAIDYLKGIHPGFVLEHELQKRNIRKAQLAFEVGEISQAIVFTTNGTRRMNTPLALRIERFLGLEEGFFMILQVYHEIEQEKIKERIMQKYEHPNLTVLRPALFWETDIKKIDWDRQKNAVIQRVFQSGNEEEKKVITRFYGRDITNVILKKLGYDVIS